MIIYSYNKIQKLNKAATCVHVESQAHRQVGLMYLYIVHVDAKRTFKNNNYLHVPQIETIKHNK